MVPANKFLMDVEQTALLQNEHPRGSVLLEACPKDTSHRYGRQAAQSPDAQVSADYCIQMNCTV